jgi:hypothetical protein
MDEYESLRVCPKCDCRLCFEAAAEPLTPDLWCVVVECPNCWFAWTRTVGDLELELLEHALDDDTRAIEDALERLVIENAVAEAEELADEVQRFSAALEANAIMPMDF